MGLMTIPAKPKTVTPKTNKYRVMASSIKYVQNAFMDNHISVEPPVWFA